MGNIPVCPLMSAGNETEIICAQEKCAWYVKNCRSCSVFLLGHQAFVDLKAKQAQAKK